MRIAIQYCHKIQINPVLEEDVGRPGYSGIGAPDLRGADQGLLYELKETECI